MDFVKLVYFVKIAETGSISRAASTLRVAQPALSRLVRTLEADFECTLFERNGRGVSMTDSGRWFYERAKMIIDQMETAELDVATASGPPLAAVTLGIAPTLAPALAPPIAAALRSRHPRVLLRISEGHSSGLFQSLESGQADVIVATREPANEPAEIRELVSEPLYYVVRSDKWDGSFSFDFETAASIPMVAAPRPDSVRTDFEAAARAHGVTPKIICETESLVSCVELVGAGVCAVVAPATALGAFPRSGRALDLSAFGLFYKVVLATPLVRPLTGAARLLCDIIIEHFGPAKPPASGSPRFRMRV